MLELEVLNCKLQHVTVLSNDPDSLQFLINVCKDCSDMDGFVLQDQKSVVLKMNSIRNYPENEVWKLGSKEMTVDSTTHMEILHPQTKNFQLLKIIFKKLNVLLIV